MAGLSNAQLLTHFENYGLSEGRASSESFNVKYYLDNYSDLKALKFNNQQAQQHFEIYGFREGRKAAPASSISPSPNRDDNTLSTAFNFGVLNGNRNFTNQFVGTTHGDDYYRFTLAQISNFNLSLTGLTDYANVELIFDGNGNGEKDYDEQLYSTSGSKSSNGSINATLGSGTYFIHVSPYNSNSNTNYTLAVSSTAATITTPMHPGSNMNTAFNIGPLSGSQTYKDFVGSVDREEWYRFSLSSKRNMSLNLTGLTDSAEVDLIQDSNNNGQYDYYDTQLGDTSGSKSSNGSIVKTLEAGTYFIRVHTNSLGNNTGYTLKLLA